MISELALNHIRIAIEHNNLSMYRGTPDGNDGGYWVQKLEDAFQTYFKVKYAVAMNSATSCLHAACLAIGVKDMVVPVSPFTFTSSASCVLMAGGDIKFVDINENDFCIKEGVVVSLFGYPKFGTFIEDCSQAIGASVNGKLVGTNGRCGIFSFNNSKTISCGEGGMLITNDEWVATKCRAIRNHAETSNPYLKMVGFNYRLGEIEAIIAYDQFTHLDEHNNQRIELCEYVTSQLKDISGIIPPSVPIGFKHVYWQYPLKVKGNRMAIATLLRTSGIPVNEGYNQPLHLLPIYENEYQEGDFPVAERMYGKELLLFGQFKPPMTMNECKVITSKIKEILCQE